MKELLKNEDWEKQFRSSLKVKDENVIKYLVQEEVLSDMIQALINEEDRTLQEASEVLGIILSNVPAINEALATTHLGALFQYLHRNTMNPRRLYFFLRVASFIFQNKSVESLKFAISSPDFTPKLVRHLSSSHIMQLMIHILNLEKQMRDANVEGCDWSNQTNLVGHVVSALEKDPSTTIEAVYKFLNEITLSYTPHSPFVKNILTQSECALPRCVINLTKDKSVSNDAIKLLDEMVLKIIMLNEDDAEFFETIRTQLSVVCSGFHKMLDSKDDLGGVIIGVKVIHALIKHKVHSLIDNSIFNCVDLCFRFPWANVLHNVIVNVVVSVFQSGELELTKSFLDAGLLRRIIEGLAGSEPVGYRPHLRIIVSSMHASPSQHAQDFFAAEPMWGRFWEIMEYRDRPEWAFNYAEAKVREELTLLLNGGALPLSLPLSSDNEDEPANNTNAENTTAPTSTSAPEGQEPASVATDATSAEQSQSGQEQAATTDSTAATETEQATVASATTESESAATTSEAVPTEGQAEQTAQTEGAQEATATTEQQQQQQEQQQQQQEEKQQDEQPQTTTANETSGPDNTEATNTQQ